MAKYICTEFASQSKAIEEARKLVKHCCVLRFMESRNLTFCLEHKSVYPCAVLASDQPHDCVESMDEHIRSIGVLSKLHALIRV